MPKKSAKDLLVQTALHQMLEKGYAGTTVDEICDTAGVSKGSFYHYFDTKEAIALAALESFILNATHLMQEGPYCQMVDPVERVFGYLAHAETVAKKIWGEGCLLGTFATDLARQHPAIQGKVRALFDEVENTMMEIFQPIAAFRPSNPTARELARQYLAMLEGSIILAKAYGDWKRIPRALKGFGQYVKLLVT